MGWRADVSYAAEDVIESHIVDQIHGGSTSPGAKNIDDFYQDLQKVILDIDYVSKEAREVKDKIGNHKLISIHSGLKRPPSVRVKNISMVGFDDVFHEVVDKLTGDQSSLRIISIVGMGGIGKTTLSIAAYENQLVVQRFDFRYWVTVSQNYDLQEILIKVLEQNNKGERADLSKLSEGELGDRLSKTLCGRRYLVVMDDVWSTAVLNEIHRFFPDNNNKSRIMITTRLSFVASELSNDHKIVMNFLDDQKAWNLPCNVVFGKETCPIELEESGRKIAKNCNGLPLSIVVIGGLLVKLSQTQGHWISIAENLNSNFKLEYEEICLQILHTSCRHLRVHLKSCFLYMGVFPEAKEIRKSTLIKLWVSEGFIKPIAEKVWNR